MNKEKVVEFLDSKIDGRYTVIEASLNDIYSYISEISSSLDSIRYLELIKSQFREKF